MATAITKFMTRILPSAQGAPSEMVRQAVIDAAAEFCQKSLSWREIQDALILVTDTADYELDFPSGARAIMVTSIWCGSDQLTPLPMAALSRVMADWQTAESPQPLYYNAAFEREGYRLFPKPVGDTLPSLRVEGAFEPTENSTTLPDFLWSRKREVIASGALARLLVLPNVAWSNPQLAVFHADKFADAIEDARIETALGNVTGQLFVPPRRFG